MTELLPCSKCRLVPTFHDRDSFEFGYGARFVCSCGMETGWYCKYGQAVRAWNRTYGAPLTLAEQPQDVAMCEDEPSVGDGVRVVAKPQEAWPGRRDIVHAAILDAVAAFGGTGDTEGVFNLAGFGKALRRQAGFVGGTMDGYLCRAILAGRADWEPCEPSNERCAHYRVRDDGVREVVPTCDGKRWRECGDPLARWSVLACSGGG